MAHKVLVGGFASGRSQVEKVAAALAARYNEDVEAISFREAMTDRTRLERLTRGAQVLTHSAGMMAIRDTDPQSITAVAPPVPVWAPVLAARALASISELAARSLPRVGSERDEIDGCMRDGAAELLVHLHGNMRWLGEIAAHDALRVGIAAREAGIDTGLVFMQNDRLFRPLPANIERARQFGVRIVTLLGAHEFFVKNPGLVLDAYEANGVEEVIIEESQPFEAAPLPGIA
ncbi:MAG TPA: hypothetical protein VIQ80_00455 [Candidatus Saccharimonadales bacterium]